jgi:hypothetical protein
MDIEASTVIKIATAVVGSAALAAGSFLAGKHYGETNLLEQIKMATGDAIEAQATPKPQKKN